MLRNLLLCGLLAGLCGGLLATAFAEVAGEPAIGRAIAFENARARAAGTPVERPLVSRTLQRSLGLLTAAVVYGVALGGLFALGFAVAYGRVAKVSPERTALWLAAAVFAVVYLVPFVKYPANPPSVGDPQTIGRRTALYLIMILISLLAALSATRLRVALSRHVSPALATLLGIGFYLVIVTVAGVALPPVDEVPRTFPADTLWRFREASVGTQIVIWSTLGLVFAATAPRVLRGQPIAPWRREAVSRS